MKDRQENLREEVKKLKWEDGITYKEIAEELLGIKYNSFVNWIHGYYDLGEKRIRQLEDYISCMRD